MDFEPEKVHVRCRAGRVWAEDPRPAAHLESEPGRQILTSRSQSSVPPCSVKYNNGEYFDNPHRIARTLRRHLQSWTCWRCLHVTDASRCIVIDPEYSRYIFPRPSAYQRS
jgi:hypothetical protein